MILVVLLLRCFIFSWLTRRIFSAATADSLDFSMHCPEHCRCSNDGAEIKCRGKAFRVLDASVFATFPKESVEVLDLSGNGIRVLSPGVFKEFDRLRKLDLSGNELETLQSSWFEGLGRLEQLALGNNRLRSVPERSLEPLKNLKFIDLASPFLTCDCNMKWFRRWLDKGKGKTERASAKRTRLRVSSGTICVFPARLRGTPFVETTRKELICSGLLEPASFSMHPNLPRFVLEGGNVSLKCNVSTMKDSEILEWLHDGALISDPELYDVRAYFVDGRRFHISELRIRNFQASDEGKWSCRLETSKGSVEKSVAILLLQPNVTRNLCPAEKTVDRKGVFQWPSTFSLSTAEITCPHQNHDYSTSEPAKNASRLCGEDAIWSDPVTDACDYKSAISRQLNALQEHKIATVEWALKSLRNVTTAMCYDEDSSAEDVNLALHLVEKVALTAKESEERMMLDIVNDLLKVVPLVLNRADERFRTGRRLLNILRSSSASAALSEFSVEDCSLSRNQEAGVTLAYFDGEKLKCAVRDSHEESQVSESVVSMEIVLTLGLEFKSTSLIVPLRFFWYRNGGVLSQVVNDTIENSDWNVYNSAVGVVSNRFADVSGFLKDNSSGYMVLRWKRTSKRSVDMNDVKVAMLMADYKTGPMHWMTVDDCSPISSSSRSVAFTCPLILGVFTLVRRGDVDRRKRGSDAFSLTPWVLASSGFAFACLLGAALIYCCCHSSVRLSVKLCHALVNCWIALAILVLTFALGIDRVVEETLCMVVAILLHYATLAVALWFFLVVRTLQRKLRKLVYPKKVDISDGEMASYDDGRPKPRHGPLVGMYFLAWGLPAMPCAFTLPLRMDSYTSNEEVCFMEPNFIALVAFAIPVVVLSMTTSLLLINAFRLLNELRNRQNKTEAPRTDLPVSADESGAHVTSNGAVSVVNGTVDNVDAFSAVSTEIGDDDGGARRHLATMGAALVLTMLSYGFAAMVVTRPWVLLRLGHSEKYFMWTITGLQASTIVFLGLIIVSSYIFGPRALVKRVVGCTKEKKEMREKQNVAIPRRRPDGEKSRKAPRHRRSRPPTVAALTTGPVDGAVSYRQAQESILESFYDPSCVDASSRRTANAGTTITRPTSQQSGTIAPSGTNVSTARSQRIQQAVAKKYYEKQRCIKMNSSTGGGDEDEEAAKEPVADEELETKLRLDIGPNDESTLVENSHLKMDMERSYHDFDGASAFSKLSNLSRNVDPVVTNGRVENRRPSVELYKKPATKLMVQAVKNGPVSTVHQSCSDEDSTPEALRNVDQNGQETSLEERRQLRVHSTNETSV